MKLRKNKQKLLANLFTIGIIVVLIVIQNSTCFAMDVQGTTIGTAEVKTATDNIKRVITSIAMPLRWCIDICKYCNCCV